MNKGVYKKAAECDRIYWCRVRPGGMEARKDREEKLNDGDKSCTGCGG